MTANVVEFFSHPFNLNAAGGYLKTSYSPSNVYSELNSILSKFDEKDREAMILEMAK